MTKIYPHAYQSIDKFLPSTKANEKLILMNTIRSHSRPGKDSSVFERTSYVIYRIFDAIKGLGLFGSQSDWQKSKDIVSLEFSAREIPPSNIAEITHCFMTQLLIENESKAKTGGDLKSNEYYLYLQEQVESLSYSESEVNYKYVNYEEEYQNLQENFDSENYPVIKELEE